jgi:hypothetical protein
MSSVRPGRNGKSCTGSKPPWIRIIFFLPVVCRGEYKGIDVGGLRLEARKFKKMIQSFFASNL